MTETDAKETAVIDFSLVKRAIPTIIVDSPMQILPYIDRAIKSRRMPSSGIKLFYLSAHPDLHVPDLPVMDLKNDSGICNEKLDSDTWILTYTYFGIFDLILWNHPTWSGQILDRMPTKFLIGEDKETGRLSVNIPETYFYRDDMFCHENDMINPREANISVSPVHETNTMCRVCEGNLQPTINKAFITIINLSCFSTQNPHLKRFLDEQFQLIDQLFVLPPPITISIPPEELTSVTVIEERGMLAASIQNAARRRQLNKIRHVFNMLENGCAITSIEYIALWPQEICDMCRLILSVRSTQPDLVRISQEVVQAIEQTLELANKKLAEIGENLPVVALASGEDAVLKALTQLNLQDTDVKALFPSHKDIRNPGCLDRLYKLFLDVAEDLELPVTEDLDDLMVEVPKTKEEQEEEQLMKYPPFIRFWHPDYVSNTEQQQRLVDDYESFMNRLNNPYLIFVVRDVGGFTPEHQEHEMLTDLLLALERIYGPRIMAISLDYKDSEKDAEEFKSMKMNLESVSETIHRIDNPPFPVRERQQNP